MAAVSSAAAGADRDKNADAASAPARGKRKVRSKSASHRAGSRHSAPDLKENRDDSEAKTEISPGLEALPEDGPGFVDAVHSRIDLIEVGVRLLRSADEKIVQRALEFMRDQKYTEVETVEEDPQRIVIDVPRPRRERQNAAWQGIENEEQKR